MTRERWLRPDGNTEALDWRALAREHDVDIATARTLYEHAMHVALDHPQLAATLYRSALRAVAAAHTPLDVDREVGRLTRVMYEALPGKYRTAEQLAAADPGKWTRVEVETTRDAAALPGYDDVQAAMRSLLGTAEPRVAPRTAPGARGPERPPAARSQGGWLPPSLLQAARAGAPSPAPLPTARLFRSRAEGAEEGTVDHPAIAEALARRGGGALLPEAVRREMEALLGADLSGVRVHTDAAAAAAAKAIGARAFTVGQDIYFALGAFDPRSARGRELLAHELTHVVQLQRGRVTDAAPGRTRVSDPSEAMEQEAEHVARHVARAPESRTERDQAVHAEPRTAHRTIWGRPQLSPRPAPAVRSSATLLRAPEPVEEGPLRIPPGGLPVEEIGVVAWDGQPPLRLRSAPTTDENNIMATLPFSARVEVLQRFAGDWLLVATRNGTIGFCAGQHVWYPPEHTAPEPNARLHRVERGSRATVIEIARRYYAGVADKRGTDLRFYVDVLGAVNHVAIPDAGDGWKTVQFPVDDIIWVPSAAFARSLHGALDTGTRNQGAASAVGLDGVIERTGQLMSDLKEVIRRAGKVLPAAIARQVDPSVAALLASLLDMAVGAGALLAISTALGPAIGELAGRPGAVPDPAAGLAVSAALLEWLGAGFLTTWSDDAAARLATAFGAFFGAVWNAEGDRAALDRSAVAFGDAIGALAAVFIAGLAAWTTVVGIPTAVSQLQGTPIGQQVGQPQLAAWLEQQIQRHEASPPALRIGPR